MKFNITNISEKEITANIYIIKDFGFSGYYPMISEKSWDKITGNENQYTVYIENFYDKLTNEDLYENDGEKFVIYIYPINKEEFEISNAIYVNNLLSKNNKYNMEIIPPNSTGAIILNVNNYNNQNYQFALCNSKEIEFTIDSSNGNFSKYIRGNEYPFRKIIKENSQISFQKFYNNQNEILIHSFESDNEFLLSYTFTQYIINPFMNYSLFSIFEIQNNILQIKFRSISDYFENYYILIAKEDGVNNIESFSNKCYISKLFINDDFNSILVKQVYKKYKGNPNYIVDNVDISELNLDYNTELVATVISSFKDFSNDLFKFYSPKEINKTIIKEIHFGEETYFNLENNSIFQFECIHNLSDREQKLSLFFNGYFFLDIILTYKDEIKKEYYNYYTNFDFNLTDSGKYYLEIYKSYNSIFDTKKGTFIVLLAERLIDIIDLSEKEYKNDKMIKLPRSTGPNYYFVTNLKKDKQFNFTFEAKYTIKEGKSPFIICNNNTDECTQNVFSYNFTKGNNYTIYIYYLFATDKSNQYYIYPSFRFYDENIDDGDEEGEDGENKKEEVGLDTTTFAIIIVASVAGFIILLILLLFIFRCFKKKNQNISFEKEANDISHDILLKEE